MALEHQSRDGQHLKQDSLTGAWQIVAGLQKPSLWTRVRNSKLYTNTYFRLGLACVAGALVSMTFNKIGTSPNGSLPIAVQVENAPAPPKSISIESGTYALVPTDTSGLPPPIVVGPGADAENSPLPLELASVAVGTISNSLDAAPTNESDSKAISKTGSSTAIPANPHAPVAVASPVRPTINALPITPAAKLPLPLPISVSPPKAAAQQVAASAKKTSSPVAGQDDGKMAVFNEPPLPLAKPATAAALPSPVTPSVQTAAALKSPASPSGKTGVRMLAVQSPTAIVVTNPSTRLPIVVKVGESLPDGSILKSIDKTASTAVSSRGEVLVLQ
jgi:hypothetical protein